MYHATLYFTQERDCILNRLLDGTDASVGIEIEEVQDDYVTFVVAAEELADEFYDRLAGSDHVVSVERLDADNLLVTKPSCGAYGAIYRNHGTLRRHNTVAGSQRVYHVLCYRREDLTAIIADLRELGTVSLGRLEEVGDTETELTDRQRTVVSEALRAGYYEWPRTVKTEDIASDLGISGATFHEHLRKAEQKIIAEALDVSADPATGFGSAASTGTSD